MLIPLVSVGVTLTLLPVMLAGWGSRLEWPRRRRRSQTAEAWAAWAHWVVRHRVVTVGVSLTLLAALAAAATSLHLGAASGEPDTISQRGPARSGLGDGGALGVRHRRADTNRDPHAETGRGESVAASAARARGIENVIPRWNRREIFAH